MITQLTLKPKINTTYDKTQYNCVKGEVQRIELHRGCPHQHEYCYEPKINVDFTIPQITKNYVEILDMNFLCRKDVVETIKELGKIKVNNKRVVYEAICGFDFRLIIKEIVEALKQANFVKIRLAWDGKIKDQYKIKDAVTLFKKANYKNISLFMIVNWKVSISECEQKLDIMKVWNVKVCDCCYDGGYKHATPTYWTKKELVEFRAKCRKHNQIVNFGLDPEII